MYIIHLGISGFPKGNAAIQRIRLTFKAFKESGYSILIFNKFSLHPELVNKRVNIKEGLPSVNTSYYINRPSSFITRTLNKLSGYINELFILFIKRKKIDAAILYTELFPELVYHRIASKLLGYKLVYQYVEYRSSIPGRTVLLKINDYLFDKYVYLFCDGIIVISEFLKAHITSQTTKLPILKIPVVCDFGEFKKIPPANNNIPYLLYCGTIEYYEVIDFILDVFFKLKAQESFAGELTLIISGRNDVNISKLNKKIELSSFKNFVNLKSNIPYSELLSYYLGSHLLLIPLRNTIQDNARFPHKIGEYTAAKKAIMSTNVGEVKYYFEDGKSAILANEYSIDEYVSKLSSYVSDIENLTKIGLEGYEIGKKNFNYKTNISKLKTFFEAQLVN
jgi:glycosyltransferase involved in cell wall biosynthesis